MLLPPFQWEPGTGVLLESTDAESFAEAARAGGLPFPGTPSTASRCSSMPRHPHRVRGSWRARSG